MLASRCGPGLHSVARERPDRRPRVGNWAVFLSSTATTTKATRMRLA